MNPQDLHALIHLLDDPDREVIEVVTSNLMGGGEAIIPDLEKAWETALDKGIQERIENVIHDIQFNVCLRRLASWKQSGAHDLLEGAWLVAKSQFPEIKFQALQAEIDTLRRDIWLEINNNLTALEKIKIVNYFIYEVYRFSSNVSNYYSPQNSYINQVLETRRGNPISLAIVYSVICQGLGIPVFGVNLPKNYILAYVDEINYGVNENNILFYINAYNKGAVLGRREIDVFLEQQKIEPRSSFYIPCNNIETVKRLFLNLIVSYEKLGYQDKITSLQKLVKVFDEK